MSGKDKYYWSQLRAALTAGEWAAQFPAKSPNGTALSWSELFRKFNKHCRGFNDVAEVASQTHALALLLAANSKDQDIEDPPEFPLELSNECLLPEERLAEASEGYEILKKLQSSNFDTLNFALAYYAYALGNPSECLAHLNKVPDVSHVNEHIPAHLTVRSTTLSLQVPVAESAPSSTAGSILSVSFQVNDGRAWAMTESFRSICLRGMSNEKLYPSQPGKALSVYSDALPLLAITASEFVPAAAPIAAASGNLNFASFTRYRELWRWVEYIIWRATALSARTSDLHREDAHNALWTWLAQYATCTAYWPSNFRTAHRSTISVLYIRALVLRNGSPPPPPQVGDVGRPPPWLHTARSVIQEYRAILSVSTRFPRAGERNVKVEEFVDLCVAVWEASGAVGDYVGWVIDVLWWATRMTFNSHRILRHMTRLLHVSGDTALAKRTLKLYVQITEKAWEASGGRVTEFTDFNRNWAETLVAGARMLCKAAALTDDGMADVREAGRMLALAKTRLDPDEMELTASFDLADGVWKTVMAFKERDPQSRPKRLEAAHAAFLRSVSAHPTPSAYYHLALSFARAGPTYDLEQAIHNAGLAVQGDPKEIRYWHLIGLLLATAEQWKAAVGILEQGADIGEAPAGEEEGLANGNGSGYPASSNGHGHGYGAAERVIDGLPDTTSPERTPAFLLSGPRGVMPPAADLLLPAADHPAPSRQEMFEYSLQLRMTQVALIEHVEGAEGAAEKWLEVFQWIAERRGLAAVPENDKQPAGMNNLKSPSELVLSMSRSSHEKSSVDPPPPEPSMAASPAVGGDDDAPLLPPTAIPITISPATPDEASRTSADNHNKVLGEKQYAEEPGPASVNGSSSSGPDPRTLKRSLSLERKPKKMQQMLKDQVKQGQARISTISKKIGSGVRNGPLRNGTMRHGHLRRTNSTPDFHAVLRPTSYQASSIHSRRRMVGSLIRRDSIARSASPPPPPPPPAFPATQQSKWNHRSPREIRLESDLWVMSAATFRRLGKIEQAKGAIQEAEVKDEGNPAVWVQLGLYHVALGQPQHAIDAFQKALFIDPDDVSASVHMCRLYLTPEGPSRTPPDEVDPANVDLASGMLAHLTQGPGWDVPEAWYYLGKAYGMQDRKDRERECLALALELSERRGVRDVTRAIGWCL